MTATPFLAPVQQNTLAEAAAARIREAIIMGKFQPGERLAEPLLAAQLGVSRSPLREALHTLETEGLVSSQVNRGTYVWAPTEADSDEILSIRTAIECLAAEWAINRMSDQDFAELEDMIEEQRQAMDAGDRLALIESDRHFHEELCRKAGHNRLLHWWRQIRSQWEVLIYRRMEHSPADVFSSILMDHRAILDALRRRDLQAVTALHKSINSRVGQEMREALRGTGQRVPA